MKKLVYIFTLALSFIIFTNTAQAFEVKVDDSVNLNKEEIADGNVYASCGDMKIDGTVNGDVIAICKSVTINGTINGDLITFSQNITINGEVKGSARLAGTNITINGTIGHNVNAFGTEINLTSSSTVAWDVLIAGVNGNFNGTIGGNLHGDIASANIGGKIGKNINLTVEDNNQGGLLITKEAIVGGGLSYTSKQEAKIESVSSIVGPVSHAASKEKASNTIDTLSNIFYKLSALFLVGLILISLKKNFIHDVAENLENKNWQTTLLGLVALILTPIIIIFFALTVIGIPLAIIILAAYLILLILSPIVSSFFVATLVLKNFIKKPINIFLILLIGLLIFVLLSALPYIGGLLTIFFIIYGLGGLIFTIKNYLYA